MRRKNAYFLIKKLLESGPKTVKELREACEKNGVSSSTFYYNLRQLVDKLKEVEKIRLEDARGFPIERYALVKEKVIFWEKSSGVRGFRVGDIEVEIPPDRRILELAAWIRYDPRGWPRNDVEVKKAKLYLQHSGCLVPEIVSASEDPDAYALKWAEDLNSFDLETLRRLNLYRVPFSRFFDLKIVYEAIVDDSDKFSCGGSVFVGAHNAPMTVDYVGVYGDRIHSLVYVGRPIRYEPIEELCGVCVAVCKGANGKIRVIQVEERWGELDKAWVKGLAKQTKAKEFRMIKFESLKENIKRELLMELREILRQRKLLIPKKYVKLIEELLDYSYKKISSAYVLALAIAVDLCLKD